jgi:hypothetical protein
MRAPVFFTTFVMALFGYFADATSRAAEIPVDLELVFAIDSSTSINFQEGSTQLEGIAAAIRSEHVTAALRAGQRIAVAVLAYSDRVNRQVFAVWRVMRAPSDADMLAGEILRTLPLRARVTSISDGVDFARGSLMANDFNAARKVILLLGDGKNNSGRPLQIARDEAVAAGVTIIGLPISARPLPELEQYFATCVAGGEGAFVLPVYTAQDVVPAIGTVLDPEFRSPGAPYIYEGIGTAEACNAFGPSGLRQTP